MSPYEILTKLVTQALEYAAEINHGFTDEYKNMTDRQLLEDFALYLEHVGRENELNEK